MEFCIERSAFTDAVAWAARVLPARSPVPVLGGLLLKADGGCLRVLGADHDASAAVTAEAETARAGRALVVGRRLLDICRVLPKGVVECAVEDTRLTVTCGDVRFGLSLLPLEDHPAPAPSPPPRGSVDADAFAAAVAQVVPAAGRDDTLPVLTGVRLAFDEGTITLAATDRYRYAVRTLDWATGAPDATADVLVPARRLAEIARSFGGAGALRVAWDGSRVAFEHADRHVTTRLLEGRLPRHDTLFALPDPLVASVEREPLAEAVKRVAVVAEGEGPLQLEFSAGRVQLRAGYGDDVASQRLPADLAGAEGMTVAFNPAYLVDALASFDASVVEFRLLGPGQRALLTDPSGRQRHLLMSVKPLV
ncbi:DNA polymerase III subunit beta [Actinacidiphila sp. bgisy160]|uniref:DNA polymerase III subunit beta n=1 Tax=Actinacidiphila sp. bgisy160 TaxID=3413796 RepID=UPI003D70AA3F